MSDIYVMQRANGDVFALDDHGGFCVPLFHSHRDAMIARSRNLNMMLFKPVALDARLLRELVPIDGGTDVDFWLVKDPLLSLKRGCLIEHAQLALLMGNPIKPQTVARNGVSLERSRAATFPQADSSATGSWEDEGGKLSKCA